MRRPSLWDEGDSGDVRSADILSEERARRLRQRRGVRAFLMGSWAPGRVGLLVLLVLLVTLVSGIAWLGFQRWGPWGEAVSASDAPWARASESARDLTVSEYSLASRYGVPLHLGQGGNPVVLVESTGEVRELTSLELEWDSAFLETASPRGRVIEVPGPRGWGMRWRDMSEAHSLRPAGSFDRFSWAARQEAELSRVVRGVTLGMEIIASVNLSLWDPASTCSRPYLRVQLPHPQASQRWKLLKEPEEDSTKIPQDKPQDQKYHQSRGKPPDRARPLPDGRQKAATNRVRPAERPDPRAQGVSAAPSARKSPASQGTGHLQELPEPRQTGPDPLPHLRRQTPRVQQAQQGQAEGHRLAKNRNGRIKQVESTCRT